MTRPLRISLAPPDTVDPAQRDSAVLEVLQDTDRPDRPQREAEANPAIRSSLQNQRSILILQIFIIGITCG